MKIKIEQGGKVEINIYDFLEEIARHSSKEELLKLADAISIQDKVIEYVSQQILDGMTEHVSYAACSHGCAEPSTPLEKATREVAKRSNEVAKNEIEALEYRNKHTQKELEKAYKENYELKETIYKYEKQTKNQNGDNF